MGYDTTKARLVRPAGLACRLRAGRGRAARRAFGVVLAIAVLAGCQLLDTSDGHRIKRVMIVGDSVMWGASSSIDEAFSPFGVQVNFVGQPATGLLWQDRLWITWVRDRLASFKPDLVIFEACCLYPGANFASPTEDEPLYVNSEGVTVEPDTPLMYEEWEKAAREMIAATRAAGATPWWVTLPRATESSRYYGTTIPERVDQFNALYRTLGVPIVDWGAPAAADPSIRYPDGIHFTEAGYHAIGDYTRDVTARLVDQP